MTVSCKSVLAADRAVRNMQELLVGRCLPYLTVDGAEDGTAGGGKIRAVLYLSR